MTRRRTAQQVDVWASLGDSDQDWGVLAERNRRHGGWGDDLDAFCTSGEAAVEGCVSIAPIARTGSVLDFGAGTGRLSLALARRFERVTSADISDGMLSTLRDRAKAAGLTNIRTVHSDAIGQGHDFATSLPVLQHLPRLSSVSSAIEVIAQALGDGGVAIAELPEQINTRRARLQPRQRVYRLLRSMGVPQGPLHRHGFSGISMLRVGRKGAQLRLDLDGLSVINRVIRPDHDYDYVRWVVRK